MQPVDIPEPEQAPMAGLADAFLDRLSDCRHTMHRFLFSFANLYEDQAHDLDGLRKWIKPGDLMLNRYEIKGLDEVRSGGALAPLSRSLLFLRCTVL
jgi:hypothetical protein